MPGGVARVAGDLVRGYAAKTSTPLRQFVTNANVCNIYFSLAAPTQDAVIARDGVVVIVNRRNRLRRISEIQLRLIFSGSIHDWSQLGLPRGPIVPVVPDADSDEGKLLASSLLYGVAFSKNVRSVRTSADVTRIVQRASRIGRDALGFTTLSHMGRAKIVRVADLPFPDASSIAAHRYPYALTFAIGAGMTPGVLAQGFLAYARSASGAAIVAKNGMIPRDGPPPLRHHSTRPHPQRHHAAKSLD